MRCSSTDSAPPALLAKIRGDLKNAMRAKDTARLNVLRSIITETNNAAKGSTPITSDMQILAMLKKRRAASKAAADEAMQVDRKDLAQKQDSEIAVLDEYAGQVDVMPEEAVTRMITSTVNALKSSTERLNPGMVLKELFKPGGDLDGKPVERSQVAASVKRLLA